ncbi:DUF3291 domain-containing protein [Rhizobium sp. LjRoot98]|uniref:DUF3291 domain-containing protein n=1 Tax=unclassified Rhizobium TaxID=2613769 RepID=UPI000712A6C9|nr:MULTISPECIES: DUF3291 domain-containing protein [unclassified Rhizobium]KQV29008.1 hypothetical protein ASC96_13485 [Rhizobium sp. Root1204]KQY03501.1 hypothetical protein ASD36_14015 [Rhizobium sp. Root1334]KRC00149.1 hypothetical protein ASE23_11820 [Rhizobium sp. Root73]
MVAGQYRLAIYNFGLHVGPEGDPRVDGFVSREPANFEAASRASGFIGRSGYRGVPGPRSWGKQAFPRFIDGSGFGSAPSSLSLWADIESLMAFSYNGVHADALKHARNWNIKPSWPPLVLWWVGEHGFPDWSDGASRLEHLHDHGASARAFTFKEPFTADGETYAIDREKVRRIVEENSKGQADLLAHVLTLKV